MRIELKAWMKETGRTAASLSLELKAKGLRASKRMVEKGISDEKRFGLDTIYHLQKMSRNRVCFNNLYIPKPGRKAS